MAGQVGLRALLHEAVHGLVVGDRPAARALAGSPPIVLLHGFGTSSRVLLPLERHLRRAHRRPVLRFALAGAAALHLGDVRDSARRVHDELQRLAGEGDFGWVDVVGHSLGGLVATYLLKCLDRGARVRRVVTLGTPHRGTPLALAGALLLGAVSRAVWQMIPGAPLLRELARLPVPPGSQLLAVASDADRVVPGFFARPYAKPGHVLARVVGLGHLDLLTAAPVLALVDAALAHPQGPACHRLPGPGIEARTTAEIARAA